jgi:phenylpropionate dioxygenase-like ring-hydroxylating dioxygenase large terminal subunit
VVDRTRISQYWHPVAESQDVGQVPLAVELLGQPIVLFRSEGTIIALPDLCVHRGAPLSMGTVANGILRCAYHGWGYGQDGRVVSIPCLRPGSAIPRAARTPSYQVEERYSLVWVALEDPVLPIPDIARDLLLKPNVHARCWARLEWSTSAGRAVENAMDIAHFPFVHPYLLADPEAPEVLDYDVETSELSVSFRTGRFRYASPGKPRATGWAEYTHDFPFTEHLRIVEPAPDGMGEVTTVLSAFHSPVSASRTRIWRLAHKDRPFTADDDAEVGIFMKILEQDREITEAVRPEIIPADLREELHLKVPDAQSVAYRRWLASVDMLGLKGP